MYKKSGELEMKFLKEYAWGIILFSGGFVLVFVYIVYFKTGFDSQTFWQSVLPSTFVDVTILWNMSI